VVAIKTDPQILFLHNPMTPEKLQEIKEKYGHMCSWAVWKERGEKEKSNMGILEFDSAILNPNIVFVGLNISTRILEPFGNFHSPSPRAHDYKIRYATTNTPFSGAYMTDVIKDFEEKAAGNMAKYITKNKVFLEENIRTFKQELEFIGAVNPIIIAFGNHAYKLLKGFDKVFKVSHYSSCVTKEELREELRIISLTYGF
jgi:hypothetical protein